MGKSQKFDPKPYYIGVWRLLKNDFLVFLLKFVSEIFRAGLWLASLAFIAVALVVGIGSGLDASIQGMAVLAGFLDEATRVLSQPAAFVGITGILAGTWALSLCIDSLALAGVWGLLGERVDGRGAAPRPAQGRRRYGGALELWTYATRHFTRVLQLQIIGLAAQATVLLVAIMTLTAIFSATTGNGALSGASLVVRALLWAIPCTLLSALTLFTRLTVELAAAPLVLNGLKPGDALLEAATLLTRRFVEVYRLFIFAATLLLLPLAFYWVLLIAQNFAVDAPALLPIFAMFRLVADAILFASAGVIAIFFKGAIFTFYHDLISEHDMTDDANHPGRINPNHPLQATRISMTRQTTLEDFLPRTYPNIVRIDALVSPRDDESDGAEPAVSKTRRGIPGFGEFGEFGDDKIDANREDAIQEDAAPEDSAERSVGAKTAGAPPPLPDPDDLSGADVFDTDSDDTDRD